MKRRVVITGMGAVTPIGNTIEEFWDGIRSGKSGIAPITHFDASEYKVKLAAEVKNFVAKERMDFKAAKRMESFSQDAVASPTPTGPFLLMILVSRRSLSPGKTIPLNRHF